MPGVGSFSANRLQKSDRSMSSSPVFDITWASFYCRSARNVFSLVLVDGGEGSY